MSKYRGKYLERIHTVSGTNGSHVIVRLNDGSKWWVTPRTAKGRRCIPKCRDEFKIYSKRDYDILRY